MYVVIFLTSQRRNAFIVLVFFVCLYSYLNCFCGISVSAGGLCHIYCFYSMRNKE